MSNAILTSKTAITTPASGDILYIVDVSDTTDNAAGSSRQITLSNLFAQSATINTNLVTLTGTQTLTNKTLTAPVISTISNTGTLTLPTSTDTLVGKDTTDTLTNKTLTSPTINSPAMSADSIDAITEIAAALKSGADTKLVTGTAGTNGNISQWNSDGDLVDASIATSAVTTLTGTQTLTNKRVTKRVTTTTDDATAVIDIDSCDQYELSAVANATEFTLTGTPTNGQTLIIRIKDAGVSKALTWTGFTAIGVTLPTATTGGKWHYVGCIYNSAASAWHAIAVVEQA